MLNLQDISDVAGRFIKENATVLLTGGGVLSVVGTGVLSWRSGYKTYERILEKSFVEDPDNASSYIQQTLTTKDKIVLALPSVAPAIVVGGAGIAAIIFSHRMSAQKAAAMAALYGISSKQLEEYKAKVEEKLTGPKAQAIKDEIAQDAVDKTPGSSQVVIVEGNVLCFDQVSGRYFHSTMEKIRQVVNETNAAILQTDGVSASYFYSKLGLPETVWSESVGWGPLEQVELEYTSTIAHNNQPCINIEFKTLPKENWSRSWE